jgi:MSHA pilin protein MshC
MIHRDRSHFGGQGGFTLIEVVMVLLILGIISYFATTRLFSEDAPTQNAEMELVKNHLRYAQSRAMNSEMSWGIKFGTTSRYWLFNTTETEAVHKRLPQRADLESLDPDIQLQTIVVSLPPGNKITFDPFGSPGGSTVTLTVQVKEGGSSLGQITITKNTGFIP